jgi:hypothetical protein
MSPINGDSGDSGFLKLFAESPQSLLKNGAYFRVFIQKIQMSPINGDSGDSGESFPAAIGFRYRFYKKVQGAGNDHPDSPESPNARI